MSSIEIEYPGNFESVSIRANGKLLNEQFNCRKLSADLDQLPAFIEIEFRPFKIKPIVRYNNFMLDYWLAKILHMDHKLEFTIDSDFYKKYKKNNIEGRLNSFSEEQRNKDYFWDKYIGINNGYPELIEDIKKSMGK